MDSAQTQQQQAGQCPMSGQGTVDLAGMSLSDPAILAHPNAFYRAMRREDPVHYDSKLDMWLVSRYEDLQTVVKDPATFSLERGYQAQYAKGFSDEFREIVIKDGGGFFGDPIMTDPPYHTRIRKLMESAFTAHRVKELEPRITAIVADLIESFADKGEVDAVNEFSVPMTIRVICEQLGLGEFARDKIQGWSLAVTAQIGRMQTHEQMLENAKQICELQNYLIRCIREREAEPREDMISDLVHARSDDSENPTLSFEEVVPLVRALLIAGNETTATAMSNLLFILATEPGIARQLADAVDDDRLLTRFVEELLRLEPPVRGLARMTTRETELGGAKLPANAHLLLLFASANDDEAVFPNPREFDMSRGNLGRHMAFSAGIHRCVGLSLARMELKVAAREIVKRLDNIELAIPAQEIRYLPTIATHSIERLPLTFTRRQ
ncbi:MAG: cytochrome P450 [Halioglobus sp.]|nr:cytochrome P450 [Halioglobus sp.]MBP6724297.1 cytochrome P450 [Halioglobus sp.]